MCLAQQIETQHANELPTFNTVVDFLEYYRLYHSSSSNPTQLNPIQPNPTFENISKTKLKKTNYTRQKTELARRTLSCRTVTSLPHGLFIISDSLNVFYFESRRSLQPGMPSKQIYENSTSQTEEYGKRPLLLIWRHTKRLSGHYTNMLLTSNGRTVSTLSSPISGSTRSNRTNNTIVTILQKV